MSGRSSGPSGMVRVAIPASRWETALASTFIADNAHRFTRHVNNSVGGFFVAHLDPTTALLVSEALEVLAAVQETSDRAWPIRRIALRARADAELLINNPEI